MSMPVTVSRSPDSPEWGVRLTAARATARAQLVAAGFADCRPASLEALVDAGSLRELGKGELLVRGQAPMDLLAILLRGALEYSTLRPGGKRHLLGIQFHRGTPGFLPIIDGLPYPSDVSARHDGTELLLIPGAVVRQVREVDPTVNRAIELQLAQGLRAMIEKTIREAGQAVDYKLACLLIELAADCGIRSGDDAVSICERLTQEEISDILVASRQRVNFELSRLRDAGFVEIRNARFLIHDLEALRRHALACES